MDAFLAIVFILICIMMIGLILLQKGRGGGLSGAFGGGGGHSAFGIRTGDTLTWITVALVSLFFLVAAIAVHRFVPDTEAVAETPAVIDAAGDQADQTAGDAAEVAEDVAEKTEDVAEQAAEMVEDAAETVTEVADQAVETATDEKAE